MLAGTGVGATITVVDDGAEVGATTTVVVFFAGAGVAGVTTVVVVSFGRSHPDKDRHAKQTRERTSFIFDDSQLDACRL